MSALTALTRNHSLKSAQKFYGQNFILPVAPSAVKPAYELGWDNFVGAGG